MGMAGGFQKWAGIKPKAEKHFLEGNIARGGNIEGGRHAPYAPPKGPNGPGPVSHANEKAKEKDRGVRDAAADGAHADAASLAHEAAGHYEAAGNSIKAAEMKKIAGLYESRAKAAEAKSGGGGGDQPREPDGKFASK
jgi:hypothetical protein